MTSFPLSFPSAATWKNECLEYLFFNQTAFWCNKRSTTNHWCYFLENDLFSNFNQRNFLKWARLFLFLFTRLVKFLEGNERLSCTTWIKTDILSTRKSHLVLQVKNKCYLLFDIYVPLFRSFFKVYNNNQHWCVILKHFKTYTIVFWKTWYCGCQNSWSTADKIYTFCRRALVYLDFE